MENKDSIPSESAIKAPKKGRLTAVFVRSVNRPGVCCDQHGLRLRVCESRKRKSISKHWVWRGTVNGTRRDAGLGAFPYVSLLDARQQAYEYRKIARAGGDPVALKRRPDAPTFVEAVETRGSKFQGTSSWIFDYGWYEHPTTLRNEQRNELQREPDQHCQTASEVTTCLSLAPPLLMQLCTLGVHESFDLARIHSYAVKVNPV